MKIAGVDEAGRGSLAGAVVAASVILDKNNPIEDLNDSKRLSAKKRNLLFLQITQKSLCWSIKSIDEIVIDDLNILEATLLAMKNAVESLNIIPDMVLVDGIQTPDINIPTKAIIKGDTIEPAISAASILAKVYRDDLMKQVHKEYPLYGFDKHKGYPTITHKRALQRYGISPYHRKSYKPVAKLL
jgi:ribonuclease HII